MCSNHLLRRDSKLAIGGRQQLPAPRNQRETIAPVRAGQWWGRTPMALPRDGGGAIRLAQLPVVARPMAPLELRPGPHTVNPFNNTLALPIGRSSRVVGRRRQPPTQWTQAKQRSAQDPSSVPRPRLATTAKQGRSRFKTSCAAAVIRRCPNPTFC
jgi:hypothetical protein